MQVDRTDYFGFDFCKCGVFDDAGVEISLCARAHRWIFQDLGGLCVICAILYLHVRPTTCPCSNCLTITLSYICSVEMVARIIVSGFVLDPEIKPSSVLDWLRDLAPGDNFAQRAHSVRRKVFEQRTPYFQCAATVNATSTTALGEKVGGPKATVSLALVSHLNLASAHGSRTDPQPHTPTTPYARKPPTNAPQTHIQSQSGTWYLHQNNATPFQIAVARQRILSEQSSTYLRHSWNRTDFVAVCSFWVMFGLAVSGMETQENAHVYVFRALSVLRTARLLAVTKGTSVSPKMYHTAIWYLHVGSRPLCTR